MSENVSTHSAADLAELRQRAEDLVKHRNDDGLLDLVEALRRDPQLWAVWWAPRCATAARRVRHSDALGLLREAVDAGFAEPQLLDGELERLFGDDPQWPQLRRDMARNAQPTWELLQWPTAGPGLPLRLDRIGADREQDLRDRLPAPAASAWETARQLTQWVSGRWSHANNHLPDADALTLLDAAAHGRRFACVEYATVLAQALNAVGIPARRLSLRAAPYHTGVLKGHVVTEAWVDDLGHWVVLDGQNGAFWADDPAHPLGIIDLQRRFRRGDRPRLWRADVPATESDTAYWWRYFAAASTTGAAWSQPPFIPIFQTSRVLTCEILVQDPGAVYPDLAEVTIGIGAQDRIPAVLPATRHPFARGFVCHSRDEVRRLGLNDAGWPLRTDSGLHETQISVLTPYAELRPATVRYRVR